MILSALLVFIGGSLGTFFRWLATDLVIPEGAASEWGLLVVNILGAGFLACANSYVSFSDANHTRGLLLFGTGFCGAFTSYSALSAAINGLSGVVLIGTYFAVTLIGGLVAVWLGLAAGEYLGRRIEEADRP